MSVALPVKIIRSSSAITRLVANTNNINRSMSGHSGDVPVEGMSATAAFNSSDQVKQEQGGQQQRQQQQEQQQVPPAAPTGTLQDVDKADLVDKRQQILWEQAVKGEQPGLSLMQDKLGKNLQETWGNEPTIMEPERQN